MRAQQQREKRKVKGDKGPQKADNRITWETHPKWDYTADSRKDGVERDFSICKGRRDAKPHWSAKGGVGGRRRVNRESSLWEIRMSPREEQTNVGPQRAHASVGKGRDTEPLRVTSRRREESEVIDVSP